MVPEQREQNDDGKRYAYQRSSPRPNPLQMRRLTRVRDVHMWETALSHSLLPPNHAKAGTPGTKELQDGSQGEKISQDDSRKKTQEEIFRHAGLGNEDRAQTSSEDRALKHSVRSGFLPARGNVSLPGVTLRC